MKLPTETNLGRYCDHRMNILETSVMRFRMAKEVMDETDLMRLAEILEVIDYEKLMRLIDKNHALYLQDRHNELDFMAGVEQRRQELRERGEIK